MAQRLHGYAQRYPHVEVKLIEAIGWADSVAMLELCEIHLGQNLAHAVHQQMMACATSVSWPRLAGVLRLALLESLTGGCHERRPLSQAPAGKPCAASRNAHAGVRLRSFAFGGCRQASRFPDVDVRIPL